MAEAPAGAYQRLPTWVLGFHGCDKEVGMSVVSSHAKHLEHSANDYDWLGGGMYFWENDPERALQFAKEGVEGKVTKGKIKTPFVVGAVIDLGLCCNLFDQAALRELALAHKALAKVFNDFDLPLPTNGKTQRLRRLDRAVIEHMHKLRENVDGGEKLPPYQTVRSGFTEGKPLYKGTTICAKNDIQIAVRDPACIRGYFLPRT